MIKADWQLWENTTAITKLPYSVIHNLETQTNKQKLPLCTTLHTTNGKIRGNLYSSSFIPMMATVEMTYFLNNSTKLLLMLVTLVLRIQKQLRIVSSETVQKSLEKFRKLQLPVLAWYLFLRASNENTNAVLASYHRMTTKWISK